MKQFDLSGMRFGNLKVIKLGDYYLDESGHKRRKWICKCDCGNTKMALSHELISGRIKSCGCLKHKSYHTTHGLSKTRLYRIWSNIKSRCNNPRVDCYENYGGRGISICEEWANDFNKFYQWAMNNGYSDNLTLERINNDGNYMPSNCKWTTSKEQSRNKRVNVFITYNGRTMTQKDWSCELGGSPSLVSNRLRRGWSKEKAVSTPIQKRGEL